MVRDSGFPTWTNVGKINNGMHYFKLIYIFIFKTISKPKYGQILTVDLVGQIYVGLLHMICRMRLLLLAFNSEQTVCQSTLLKKLFIIKVGMFTLVYIYICYTPMFSLLSSIVFDRRMPERH